MIDFNKAYCSLHPHDLITNFCNKEQCLAPLCANCICTHTECHVEKGTSPDYENIRTTYRRIQDNLRNQIELFETEKERIDKISVKIAEKRSKLKNIIELAREQCEKFIHNFFEEKEKKLLREIQMEEKKQGLHCESRLEALSSYISREISSLLNSSEDLTSTKFLESLPRIRTQVLTNSSTLYQEISNQLQQNENFTTALNYDPTYLNVLHGMLDKSIQLRYSSSQRQIRTPVSEKDSREKSVKNMSMNQSYFGMKSPHNRNTNSELALSRRVDLRESNLRKHGNHSFNMVNQVARYPQKKSYLNDIPNEHAFRPMQTVFNYASNWQPAEAENIKIVRPEEPRNIQKIPMQRQEQEPKVSVRRYSQECKGRVEPEQDKRPDTLHTSQIQYTLRASENVDPQANYSSGLRKSRKTGLKLMGNLDTENNFLPGRISYQK